MKKLQISKIIPYLIVIIMVIMGTILSDNFLSARNFTNIIKYSVEATLIAVGMTFIILTGGIDLSVGSILAYASVVSAKLVISGVGIVPVIIVVIIIGLAAGLINGLLITKAKVEPFMATLGMMMIMRAMTFLFTGGGPILGTVPAGFRNIVRGSAFGIPYAVFYVIITLLIAYLTLNRTPFGRHVLAVGGSEETAKLFGVKVNNVKIAVYVISGILAAISGMLIASRIGIGEPRSGYSYEMTAISMVVVGGTSMEGGKGTIMGTFIGILVISMLMNLMNLMNINTNIQPIFEGIIILITALVISREDSNRKLATKKGKAI